LSRTDNTVRTAASRCPTREGASNFIDAELSKLFLRVQEAWVTAENRAATTFNAEATRLLDVLAADLGKECGLGGSYHRRATACDLLSERGAAAGPGVKRGLSAIPRWRPPSGANSR
jgi:hypothetical protein